LFFFNFADGFAVPEEALDFCTSLVAVDEIEG
jgi:hypothetical protein